MLAVLHTGGTPPPEPPKKAGPVMDVPASLEISHSLRSRDSKLWCLLYRFIESFLQGSTSNWNLFRAFMPIRNRRLLDVVACLGIA
jgi:hypothetical protein